MKRIILCVFALCVSACGGGGGSPTAPNTPAPPPPPMFTSLVGNWSGTLTIIVTSGGTNASNTCTHTWSIGSQTQGQFSGTFQLSGGSAVSCAQAGTVSGTIGTDNRITGLSFGVSIGTSGCTRNSGDGVYTGQFANGTISATTNDTLTCGPITAARNLTISLTR